MMSDSNPSMTRLEKVAPFSAAGGGGNKLFKVLKDLGYTVKVHYVDVPTDLAVDRAEQSAENGERRTVRP
jgi:hypothetical protein